MPVILNVFPRGLARPVQTARPLPAHTGSLITYEILAIVVLERLIKRHKHRYGVDVALGLDRCKGFKVEELLRARPGFKIHLVLCVLSGRRVEARAGVIKHLHLPIGTRELTCSIQVLHLLYVSTIFNLSLNEPLCRSKRKERCKRSGNPCLNGVPRRRGH